MNLGATLLRANIGGLGGGATGQPGAEAQGDNFEIAGRAHASVVGTRRWFFRQLAQITESLQHMVGREEMLSSIKDLASNVNVESGGEFNFNL